MKKTKEAKKQEQQQESSSLLSDLQDHNAFFDSLVDMIPSKLYHANHNNNDDDDDDDGHYYNTKYFKGQHKENREARRAQQKAQKRAKYDPTLLESESPTNVEESQEKGEKNGKSSLLPTPHPKKQKKESCSDASASSAAAVEKTTTTTPDTKSRIEALRAKLQAKIAEKAKSRPTDPAVISKRAARRAEKQRRKDEAIRKKKSAQSKVADGKNSKYTVASALKNGTPADDLAQIDFGRLTGLNHNNSNAYQSNNKALANVNKSKNLQKILADAEQKQQKLEALKRSHEEADKEQLAKMQWSDALKEASGERVKDDPTKIKKQLKRKAAKKAKSAKAWKSRLDHTQQKMDERQQIRNHNLNQRRQGGKAGSNLSKKRIDTGDNDDNKTKSTTTGTRRLNRPGFEGRRQAFLTSPKQQ